MVKRTWIKPQNNPQQTGRQLNSIFNDLFSLFYVHQIAYNRMTKFQVYIVYCCKWSKRKKKSELTSNICVFLISFISDRENVQLYEMPLKRMSYTCFFFNLKLR